MKSAIRALALLALLAAPPALASGNQNDQGQNEQGNQSSNGGTWGSRLDPTIPEPSAALVFGVGLLTIGSAGHRRATSCRAA